MDRRPGPRSSCARWDSVQKMPKEIITTMKTYCEFGIFQHGQEAA